MLDRFDNMTILNRLFEIYPDQGKNGDGYVEALDIRMQAWDESRRQHYMRKSKFWKDGHDKPARSRTTKN